MSKAWSKTLFFCLSPTSTSHVLLLPTIEPPHVEVRIFLNVQVGKWPNAFQVATFFLHRNRYCTFLKGSVFLRYRRKRRKQQQKKILWTGAWVKEGMLGAFTVSRSDLNSCWSINIVKAGARMTALDSVTPEEMAQRGCSRYCFWGGNLSWQGCFKGNRNLEMVLEEVVALISDLINCKFIFKVLPCVSIELHLVEVLGFEVLGSR